MGTIGKLDHALDNSIYLVRRVGNDRMDFATENRPETCSNLGLECSACVSRCAATTAAICPDLLPSGVHKMFFQLYPSAGCQPMAFAFQRAYEAAATPARPMAVAVSAAAAA
ncbi:MAG TPA: hypothetical protein VFW44_13610 [Bryobacteraceae bacterium]|nr:hypothetical protein [Bryobacteraceae bacterium]